MCAVGRRARAEAILGAALIVLALACRLPTEPGYPMLWHSISGKSPWTCGLAVWDQVFCWGRPQVAIADGSLPQSATPVAVKGVAQLHGLSTGGTFACAIDSRLNAWCAGLNDLGQLGRGEVGHSTDFVQVAGDREWRTVAAGYGHACGITVQDSTFCWGNQFNGALGNGVDDFSGMLSPVAVLGDHDFRELSLSLGFSCALDSEDRAWCWGGNYADQLGIGGMPGAVNDTAVPVQVAGNLTFRSIVTGGEFACAIATTKKAYCWGANPDGRLGIGIGMPTAVTTPTEVHGGPLFRTLTAGAAHTCGVSEDWEVWCWGYNANGQFGDGTRTSSSAPRRINHYLDFVEISATGSVTCGITRFRQGYCWGSGDFGQAGNGDLHDNLRPVPIRR